MQEAAYYFKDFVPLVTHNKIESVVDYLWDKAKAMPREELCREVESWVVDPGNTDGRVVAYNILLMIY